MRYIPICFLLLAVSAWAQPVPPPPHNTITVQSSPGKAPPISSPASIGAPHICTNDYPPEAIAVQAQGTTTVGFTITESGSTAGVKVILSSGNEALDKAAVTCSSRWLYRPAMQDGKPVAVTWKAQVKWLRHFEGAMYAPIPLEQPHDCSAFAPEGVVIPAGAVTTLRFHVTAEGKVTNVVVVASSGSPKLDKAAMFCALRWSYKPARKDDQAVEVSWRENVAWK
jgi:TonB family protein